MNLLRLVRREIRHRLEGFLLSVICVAVAAGSLMGALTLLTMHDLKTRQIVDERRADIDAELAKLKDDYRKLTKAMGFNVLILPKDQNLADLYAKDYADKFMPEAYADKLANSRIVTVRHLLPSLRQKVKWPERQRTIVLVGAKAEIPLPHRAPKGAILKAVDPGTMVVGHELHQSLNLKKGDKVELMGRQFTVARLHKERGNIDDITIWIDLPTAQELLNRKGLINGILALECSCAWAKPEEVRREICGILPDTQVIEFASKALARAEARNRAKEHAETTLMQEQRDRDKLRQSREDFAAAIVPLTIMACGVWIAYLALGNVRARRAEIGILRALGLTSSKILWVFLLRAMFIGLSGAIVGATAGILGGNALAGRGVHPIADLIDPVVLVLVILITPALSMLASLAPALSASRQDPADVLREE
jgi:putative ABC transport system permease protein